MTIATARTGSGILRATIYSPDTLNRLAPPDLARLAGIVGSVRDDPSLRTLVLTGSGGWFCSGVATGANGIEEAATSLAAALSAMSKPVVAAINGPALAGGFALALLCHKRVIVEGACVGPSFVPGVAGGTELGLVNLLVARLGHQRASELFYTGRSLQPLEAQELGLVDEIAADGPSLHRRAAALGLGRSSGTA